MGLYFTDLFHGVWLLTASLLAGILNSIAGGGSFLSLPALFANAAALGVGAPSGCKNAGKPNPELKVPDVPPSDRSAKGTGGGLKAPGGK